MPYGKRSVGQGPWHYCGVCDIKTHIDELEWQRGTLKCQKCTDVMLVGQRDQEIAQVLGDGAQELTPVPKLTEPDVATTVDDIWL